MAPESVSYSPQERFWLQALAVFSFVVLNGVFLWAAIARPDAMRAAMSNPISAMFMIEAFVLVGVFAYLLRKWGVTRLHWGWFVALSIIGSLAFALPIALLWKLPNAPRR